MNKLFTFTALLMMTLILTATPALAATFDWEKAVSLYKQNQFRVAIAEFQKVLAEHPDHSDSWKFVGLAHYQLKEYDAAIQPLEKALAPLRSVAMASGKRPARKFCTPR